MLSGSFHSFPISSITVAPDRQRKEPIGIEELAASIEQVGLIHPIVLTPEGQLVAGERRLLAHKLLERTHIIVQFTTDLSPEDLEVIELEENVKRKELPWKDEVAAVVRFHELKKAADPTWTQQDTESILSISRASLSECLLITSYMNKGEQLVLEATSYTTARNICFRKEQRAEVEEKENLDKSFDKVFSTSMSVEVKRQKVGELPMEEPKQPDAPYLNADFRSWAAEPWDGPKFNFIHCDFPYGINFDKHNGGATGLLGGYEDTPELFQECIGALAGCLRDRVSESAHIMFWLSGRMEIVWDTMGLLEAMGWKMNPVPLIWHRNDNSGILPDPQRGPRQVYEVCLFGSRGDRKIVQAVANLFAHPKTKDIHASEKPRAMLQHFFRMFVDESTVMLDPTMGSGNSILAAEESNPKFVLGIEALENIFKDALSYRNRVKRRD